MLTRYRSVFDPLVRGIGRALVAVGVTPMGLTWTGLALQAAGAVFVARHALVGGTVVWALGAAMDAFDGTVARMAGRVTRRGGYLDSLLDRYGDAAILVAIGWHYDEAWVWAVCLAALLGSVATSYAKARAYQDVRVASDAWPDLLERPERALILGFATGFQGLADAGWWPGAWRVQFLPWIVAALALLTHATVVQRARRAIRFIEAAEARD